MQGVNSEKLELSASTTVSTRASTWIREYILSTQREEEEVFVCEWKWERWRENFLAYFNLQRNHVSLWIHDGIAALINF